MTRARGLGGFTLLDQVRECLFHEHLQLAAFLLGKATHSGEDLGIDLGCEFLTGGRHEDILLSFHFYHDLS